MGLVLKMSDTAERLQDAEPGKVHCAQRGLMKSASQNVMQDNSECNSHHVNVMCRGNVIPACNSQCLAAFWEE